MAGVGTGFSSFLSPVCTVFDPRGPMTGARIVAVLLNDAPVVIPGALAAGCDALLEAWVPGSQGGSAIASMLFGLAQPGGRLPVSLPIEQKGKVRHHAFPLGFGLSYSTFQLRDFHCSTPYITASSPRRGVIPVEHLEMGVTIVNTGARDGDEVVQCYARLPARSVTRPARQLLCFRRVHVGAGRSVRVDLSIPTTTLLVRTITLVYDV